MPNIQDQFDSFRQTLKANDNPERAVQEKRYLKSPFKFFGVSLPLTDKIAKEFRKTNSNASSRYILELAQTLWDSEYHDEKRLGYQRAVKGRPRRSVSVSYENPRRGSGTDPQRRGKEAA